MKRLLFITWSMSYGYGTEKSLADIINRIDTNEYIIDVLPLFKNSETNILNDKINILDSLIDYTIKNFNEKNALEYYYTEVTSQNVDKWSAIKYLISKIGVKPEEVVFQFVDNYKNTEPLYQNGNYVGQRFTGYTLRQPFTIESTDVEAIENISREISALLAQGIQIESTQPDYYYSGLDGLKLELIGRATADARARAEEIASESGAKLRKVKSGRMGVFQITGANTNEEFSAGGNFNTSSKNKKARITIRLEYIVR